MHTRTHTQSLAHTHSQYKKIVQNCPNQLLSAYSGSVHLCSAFIFDLHRLRATHFRPISQKFWHFCCACVSAVVGSVVVCFGLCWSVLSEWEEEGIYADLSIYSKAIRCYAEEETYELSYHSTLGSWRILDNVVDNMGQIGGAQQRKAKARILTFFQHYFYFFSHNGINRKPHQVFCMFMSLKMPLLYVFCENVYYCIYDISALRSRLH